MFLEGKRSPVSKSKKSKCYMDKLEVYYKVCPHSIGSSRNERDYSLESRFLKKIILGKIEY